MSDIGQRLERLEAREAIRDLASRYAQALDARDLDALVGLFVDDVDLGDGTAGRSALGDWFDRALRSFGVSFHLIGNHLIDLVGDDRASGTLYCRGEYEVGDLWIVAPMHYTDEYERRGGTWYFQRRSAAAFYAADLLEHPNSVPGRFHFPGSPMLHSAQLPESWQSWQRFIAGPR